MNLFKIKIRLETRPAHSRSTRIIGIYNEQKKIEKINLELHSELLNLNRMLPQRNVPCSRQSDSQTKCHKTNNKFLI